MKQLSYHLDLFLCGNSRPAATTPPVQEDLSAQLLIFLHEHTLWQQWLESTDLTELWRDHKLRLLEALTHPSLYHQVAAWPTPHNQRLEFLGDSALDFYVSKKLIARHPREPEGTLSKLRSTIVNEEGLAMWARAIHLPDVLLVGRGEVKKLEQEDMGASLVADAFEALVGVMSTTLGDWEERLDQWVQVVEEKQSLSFFSKERLEGFDPKTTLQEKTLALYRMLPRYEDRETDQGEFVVTLKLGAYVLGRGQHISKKKAKTKAAQYALQHKTYLGLTAKDYQQPAEKNHVTN